MLKVLCVVCILFIVVNVLCVVCVLYILLGWKSYKNVKECECDENCIVIVELEIDSSLNCRIK